jgi:orotate phosphoribosyltransferase
MDRDYEQRLFDLLFKRAFILGEVDLSSGAKSNFYIDGKMVAGSPEGAFLLGEVLYDHIKDFEFDAIGGLAVGAVPIVTSVVISCYRHERSVEGFWVREERKSHGTRKLIEGRLPEHANVIIVDDVVTSGNSVLKAIDAIEAKGARVVRVVAIVDREEGAAETLKSRGYSYDSIFSKEHFFAACANTR